MSSHPQPRTVPIRLGPPAGEPRPSFPGFTVGFARNQEVYAAGDPTAFVYRVITGMARTVSTLRDGRRQITAFHVPGDVFGLERGAAHELTAEAVVGTQLALSSRALLDWKAARESDAAFEIWSLAAQALVRTQSHLLVLGRMTAAERVASFLLDLAARTGAGTTVNLAMGRGDIADYLGLTIETISRTLHDLEQRGVIALLSCRKVRLLDLGELRVLGHHAGPLA